MYGVTLAFKDFNMALGILKSSWVGTKYFNQLLSSSVFRHAFWNTIIISIYRILWGFPAPILLAILVNEVVHTKFKKAVQTISYFPYFISWVILGGIIVELLSPTRGVLNYIISHFGGIPVYFLTQPQDYRTILVSTGIWQSVGYGSIIYIAAITGIDIELYDAAIVDGANRFQKIWHITFPGIMPVIIVMLILTIGQLMNAGFDQIMNTYNAQVYATGDIIDTYVYRVGVINMSYSLTTAAGFLKNVIGLVLLIVTNFAVTKMGHGESAIW